MSETISIIWHVNDVLAVRPDLTSIQAFEVLQHVHRKHDATLGVTWDTLAWVADYLFGEAEA